MDDTLNKIDNGPSIWTTIKAEFITDDGKKVDDVYLKHLYYNVNRSEVIGRYLNVLKDMDDSIAIEKGIFEFTLVYTSLKNYSLKLLPAIYFDKVNEIELNLKDNNYLGNTSLRNALKKHIGARTLAFLRPHDLHPERWGTIIKKNNLREEKKNNMATTDLYECVNCGESKCRMVELQLRGADEPTTKIITCINCYHVEQKE